MSASNNKCPVCFKILLSARGLAVHHSKMHSVNATKADPHAYFCTACATWIDGNHAAAHTLHHEAEQHPPPGLEERNDMGFQAANHGSPYFFLEAQSRVENQTMDQINCVNLSEEDEIKRRTLKAFGEIIEAHNVSHRLGNALLKFMTNPLYRASSLDRCLKTVIRKYRKLLTQEVPFFILSS